MERHKIENLSGWNLTVPGKIESLKQGNVHLLPVSLGGEAPKALLALYVYGESTKRNRSKWPRFIAKTGSKWYPVESITEFMINKLGEWIGFNMNETKLLRINDQLRFLSRHFHKSTEELVHGADIYAGYLEDRLLVETIEADGEAIEHFTVQLTQDSIFKTFPSQGVAIFEGFIKMLVFDAFVGNSDRHFYNWGVIRSVASMSPEPRFSPIYDSARGLLWNYSEKRLLSLKSEKEKSDFLSKYSEMSKPKIGWQGLRIKNHYDLLQAISVYETGMRRSELERLFQNFNSDFVFQQLNVTFEGLLSPLRMHLIERYLKLRIRRIESLLC
jgi:hypothetical protein